MDFWPAPGGCPTNGASFPSLNHALMLGAGRGPAPSLGSHRQGAFGRGRPAWSSKTRARPRELLHRLSRWPTPPPETAAPGPEALGSGSACKLPNPAERGLARSEVWAHRQECRRPREELIKGPTLGCQIPDSNLKAGRLWASASSSEKSTLYSPFFRSILGLLFYDSIHKLTGER